MTKSLMKWRFFHIRNLFSKGVNDSSKVSTCSGKKLSTTSGKRTKTVNQNQEKTKICGH